MTNKMIRIIRDGVPCYVAEWFKDLSPRSRHEMHRCAQDWQDGWAAPKKTREECAKVRHAQTAYEPKFPNFAIAAE